MISLNDVELTVVVVPMRTVFRRVSWREAVLIQGPAGWGEFSPFPDYPATMTARWLAAALEWACVPFDQPTAESVPVNVTIPAVDPDTARRLVDQSGSTTAKVKVANPGDDLSVDMARVAAVRDALGPNGSVRIDVNAAWTVEQAEVNLAKLSEFELQYVEQPVATIAEMCELRKRVDVLIAADESVRQSADPLQVVEEDGADLLVLKVQPLGGMERTLDIARRSGLPVVVSSALETSIGLSQGIATAALLNASPTTFQGEALAHGLGTGALMAGDVVLHPLLPVEGSVATRRPVPDPELVRHWRADRATESVMLRRLRDAAELLT